MTPKMVLRFAAPLPNFAPSEKGDLCRVPEICSTEEELMLAHSYPDFESHKTLHLGFTANVKGLRARAFKGDSAVSEEALKFLTEWLIHHDIAVDKKLGTFLLERGIE